jgi:signal transduction histidine kinase
VKRFPFVTVMILLVGGVLGGSVWMMRRAGREALHEFRLAQSQLAHDTAVALFGYLDSFDRDTRLLATLAQGTRRQPIGRGAQDQIVLTAFQALATVVPHYRTICLFAPGRDPIIAVDPTEDRAQVAPQLVAVSADLAASLAHASPTAWRGPVTLSPSRRSFYLSAAALGGGETVVVTSDAAMMLESVSRSPSGQGLAVIDPNGQPWVGCEQRQRCRLLPDGTERTALFNTFAAARDRDELDASAAVRALGFPARIVVGTTAPVRSALGRWSVAMVASAADIDVRHRAFLWQLLLTSIGVAVAMLTVGIFLLRQHATAAALTARLQAAEELASLRERSERVLENVPVGILGLTRYGAPALTNRFFKDRIVGPPARTAQTGPLRLIDWTSRIRAALDRALASGRIQNLEDGTETLSPDYQVRIIPLTAPADEIAALALVEDLSELHSLQRQLVRAEKLVTVGVLSAGIAHEVGTPLSVIRGRAEHLLERVRDDKIAEDLAAIVAQIDRISSTIRQVLEFSRDHPVEPGPADARRGVEQALALLEWRVSGKQAKIALDADEALPPIAADLQQFEQVILNLLMNALDASATGGAIEIAMHRDPERPRALRLTVTDHGVGIPRQHLNAVFDPYFTTKKNGEGTGLGLAIVSQMVRSHRGEITLASAEGLGTTVTVRWPFAEAAPGVADA